LPHIFSNALLIESRKYVTMPAQASPATVASRLQLQRLTIA